MGTGGKFVGNWWETCRKFVGNLWGIGGKLVGEFIPAEWFGMNSERISRNEYLGKNLGKNPETLKNVGFIMVLAVFVFFPSQCARKDSE